MSSPDGTQDRSARDSDAAGRDERVRLVLRPLVSTGPACIVTGLIKDLGQPARRMLVGGALAELVTTRYTVEPQRARRRR